MSPRRLLAILLVAGTLMLAAGAVLHPMLSGDGASHLRTIGEMTGWRTLHLAMLAGSGLVAVGVWTRLFLTTPDLGVAAALVAALITIAIGEVLNALNIAYMASAGVHLASRFAAGDPSALALYDTTHPIGQMAARFGNLLVAVGAIVLALAERRDPSGSRLAAVLAGIAGVAGVIGVILAHESSPLALTAVGALSGWQILTGMRGLRGSHPARDMAQGGLTSS